MTRPNHEIRALRQLVNEARSAGPPSIRWAALERELFAELDGQPPFLRPLGRPRSRAFTWTRLLFSAALLGSVAVATVALLRAPGPGRPPGSSPSEGPRVWTEPLVDAAQARVGDRFLARQRPLTVRHAGLGEWQLSKGGEATLTASTPAVVQLQHGELFATITPGAGPAAFVVEAGQARITVKGTVFRVERRTESIHVSVEQGKVSVSSLAGGAQTFDLTAPAAGEFSLDARVGRLWDGIDSASEPPPQEAPPTRAASPGAIRADADTVPPPLPKAPALADVAPVLEELTAALGRCLAAGRTGDSQIALSFVTQATLKVSPAGEIVAESFDPPIAAAARGCFAQALPSIRFVPSLEGVELVRRLEVELPRP